MSNPCPHCGAPTVEGVVVCGACNRPVTAPAAYAPPPVTWSQSVTPLGYGPAPAAPAAGAGTRPTGVTVLAVIYFIGAGLFTLAALLMFVGGAAFGSLIGGADGAGLGAAIGGLLGLMMLAGAAITGLLGWGVWTAKAWAWIVVLIFQGVGVASGVLGLVNGDYSALFGLAVSGLIIWYFLQPNVKAYFGRT